MASTGFSTRVLPLVFVAFALVLWGLALYGYASRGKFLWHAVIGGLFCLFFATLSRGYAKRS